MGRDPLTTLTVPSIWWRQTNNWTVYFNPWKKVPFLHFGSFGSYSIHYIVSQNPFDHLVVLTKHRSGALSWQRWAARTFWHHQHLYFCMRTTCSWHSGTGQWLCGTSKGSWWHHLRTTCCGIPTAAPTISTSPASRILLSPTARLMNLPTLSCHPPPLQMSPLVTLLSAPLTWAIYSLGSALLRFQPMILSSVFAPAGEARLDTPQSGARFGKRSRMSRHCFMMKIGMRSTPEISMVWCTYGPTREDGVGFCNIVCCLNS